MLLRAFGRGLRADPLRPAPMLGSDRSRPTVTRVGRSWHGLVL